MVQARKGRRGSNFSVRLTDEERAAIEAAMPGSGGPRNIGPWLVWRALVDRAGSARARPVAGAGTAGTGQCPLELHLGEQLGQCPAGEALPGQEGQGGQCPAGERLILDLCGGSGSWSAPYREAGYRVQLVDLPDDVRLFVPQSDVWGILAAPPCDQFSLARNGHDSPRDILRGLEVVSACIRVIMLARPRWWALENPVGLLSHYLGTPRDVWQPCDFGDPWTKRTAIWGDFRIPRRGPFVQPLGGGPLCRICDPERRKTTWCSNAGHRAVTPPGFARAFFEANP